jgi:perosamine synthetase
MNSRKYMQKTKIPLFYPYIPKNKILKELSNTLDSRYVGQGPKVEKFEKEFGKALGYKYPLFVNSGTSALELAYHLLDLKEGDEVIVPVFNCTAGLMGLKRRGVKIVFADIDDNLNIDVVSVLRNISGRTKAIIAVGIGGLSVNPEVYDFAKSWEIPVITDSAQHMAHSQGDFIIHSFQAIKHITTGDGGMLILKDKKTYERAKRLRWFGIDKTKKPKHREMTQEPEEAGYKFQPTDIDASFGLAGLSDLSKVLAHRKKLGELYRKLLSPTIEVVTGGSYWLVTILCNKRDRLADYLDKHGVEVNLVHLRNDKFKVFGGKKHNLPIMNLIENKYLCLPINTKVTTKDVRYICKLINDFY